MICYREFIYIIIIIIVMHVGVRREYEEQQPRKETHSFRKRMRNAFRPPRPRGIYT